MENTCVTVLIIEDVLATRIAWKALLEDEGFKVLTARDDIEGLKMLRTQKVDVTILDLSFPTEGREAGFRMLKKKSKIISIKDIPVIIVTGIKTQQTVNEEAKEFHDVKAIFEKAVDNDVLVGQIQEILAES